MKSSSIFKTLIPLLFLFLIPPSESKHDVKCSVGVTNHLPHGQSVIIYVKEGKDPLPGKTHEATKKSGNSAGTASVGEVWELKNGDTLHWPILVKKNEGPVMYYFFWNVEGHDASVKTSTHLVLDSKSIGNKFGSGKEIYEVNYDLDAKNVMKKKE